MLEGLRKEFDLPVDVLLGGLRPGSAAQTMDAAMLSYLVQAWDRVEAATGVPFGRAQLDWQGWTYDTELPCRAVVAARSVEPAKTMELFRRIQTAFYADGADVTTAEVLVDLAREAGLDADAFETTLLSEANKAQTYGDFQAARRIGITGFPALLAVHGDRAWAVTLGYQPLEQTRAALEEAMAHFDPSPSDS